MGESVDLTKHLIHTKHPTHALTYALTHAGAQPRDHPPIGYNR
jgi:hypothetical protein